MKNFKLFGIIALVAVIGFSMAACDDGSGDNNNNNGGGGGGGGGDGWSVWQTARSDFLDSQTSGITIMASGNIATSIEVEIEGLSYTLSVVNGYRRDIITAYDPTARNSVRLRYKPSSAKCQISGSSVYFSDN